MAFQGPPGHGENIWVFAHRRTSQIIYSFNATLDGVHDMKQLPYNGKKTKPAKLRKDYWAPMAKIAFPKGAGSVGCTVFQKLRELKHLHEVSWDDTLLYKKPIEYNESQRKAAAKRAAEEEPEPRFTRSKAERGKALNAQKANSVADMAAVLGGAGPGNKIVSTEKTGRKKLVEVTVTWANILDAGYAQKWSHNVAHSEMVEPVAETALPAEAEAAA
ncbi:hypothetical protein V2A60_008963 [Cordyceps javanica]|uniref:Large ribosomal subunit protein mL67 n=1 Tax=Cordyceps javanica TaxID=43265 RepID=A0A545UPJ4_9HYPO|nr:transcriptional regulation of mitochondrial recombination domain-containing protein [Cordyceps javanica]TQW03196.1 transcriptional regulation of mitochondrial recombination domain-containing protein [Cordyceps javanica]